MTHREIMKEGEKSITYPIAETFNSIQGEGYWVGTPMLFVRLAGCNVGRYAAGADFSILNDADLKLYDGRTHSVCTTFDGQRFLCDTDYHTKEHLTPEEIVGRLLNETHICITGGEPFLHDLIPLIEAFNYDDRADRIHVETSGTLPIPKELSAGQLWITCCPKTAPDGVKMHPSSLCADEWKVLVGPTFDERHLANLEKLVGNHRRFYLQPINGVNDIWKENVKRCMSLLSRWPKWKLSPQLHKYTGVR